MTLCTVRKSNLALFFICLLASTLGRAEIRLNITPLSTSLQADEARRILENLHNLVTRLPENDWEQSLIDSGKTSLGHLADIALGPPIGMATSRNGSDDILITIWKPDDRLGIRDLWIWDTADFNWFVLRCDPSSLSSTTATQSFMKEALKWPYHGPEVLQLQILY